jgi:predicted Zn-dependent protease
MRTYAITAGIMLALAVPGGSAVAQTVRSISASDKAQGAKAHPELLQQFGGAYRGPQAAYVERVGKRIALQSGLSNSEKDFTVTLLDSPVNNAFAIPGGYVYVTRQLLALMNDEAELASVLGHEIGHVAARHSNKRNTTSTLGSILAAGVGVLTGSSELGQIAGYGAQLYTLRFSREQEYAADDLGIRYLRGAGYDPYAAADMLAKLNAMATVDARVAGKDANAMPSWASTHPNTTDRVARARQRAQAAGAAPGRGTRNREAFLAAIDGMIYDDNPSQGVVDGQSFKHPDLKLGFTAPQGYVIANSPSVVAVTGAGGQAQFQGGKIGAEGLRGYVDSVFQGLGGGKVRVNYGDIRTTTVNGIDAAYAMTRASTQSGPVDVTVFAYQFAPGTAYQFVTITPQGSGLGAFVPLIDSMHRLNASEASNVRAKRIQVVTVKAGDTIETLANRMAYSNYRMERFLALNGLAADARLRAGDKVKLVVSG